jgi:hypothetical protein
MARGVFTGARNREKARAAAVAAKKAIEPRAGGRPELESVERMAIRALADAVETLCDELEQIEKGDR